MKSQDKLSTLQIVLISTGGMIGAGWLFSPFFGFETAGIGVLLSWGIVALLTLIIGLSFAEVITIAPIVGGLSRFMTITHNRTIAFLFLTLGWLSYVVYLPIEVQAAMQYLGMGFPGLIEEGGSNSSLTYLGLAISVLLIVLLTWFNCFLLKNVARVNSAVSIWKILAPIAIAWLLIVMFGSWDNVHNANAKNAFSFETVLLAITGSGLAFAFTGFQNALILANSAKDPKKAMPYSLIVPIIIGFILYASLSILFITCLGDGELSFGKASPLLGIVTLLGVHVIINTIFISTVIAPLGTSSVYAAVTSRVLYGLAKDFFPKSLLAKLNNFSSPVYCLWVNAVIGVCFLVPLPTWQQLVDFLSSIVVFSYLAGPVAMLVLRKDLPKTKRPFSNHSYNLIGYAGFACCSLLIYWSSIDNLIFLAMLTAALIVAHNILIEKDPSNLINSFKENFYVVGYVLTLFAIKYAHHNELVAFPVDNALVIIFSYIACNKFISKKASKKDIEANLKRVIAEKS